MEEEAVSGNILDAAARSSTTDMVSFPRLNHLKNTHYITHNACRSNPGISASIAGPSLAATLSPDGWFVVLEKRILS